MIKINLLETAKAKKRAGGGGGSSAVPKMEMGDLGSPLLKVLAVVVVAGVCNFGYWYRLDHQAKAIESQIRCVRRSLGR